MRLWAEFRRRRWLTAGAGRHPRSNLSTDGLLGRKLHAPGSECVPDWKLEPEAAIPPLGCGCRGGAAKRDWTTVSGRARRAVGLLLICAAPALGQDARQLPKVACRPYHSALEAAVGIFTHPGHGALAAALRVTLRAPSSMRICYILRSANATAASFVDGDRVLVPCPELGRATGPLCSLVRWFQAAVEHFPLARMIGKADDDAVWHPERVLASLKGVEPTHALWGQMETYHWNHVASKATGFGWGASRKPCAVRGSLTGPFSFPKGPLFLASRALVVAVVSNATLVSGAEKTWRAPWVEKFIPWEDVWLGMALHSSSADGLRLDIHHIGWGPFSEQWGWSASPSTMVWHMKKKDINRVNRTYAMMDQNWQCQFSRWSGGREVPNQCGQARVRVFSLQHTNRSCDAKHEFKQGSVQRKAS